MIEIGQDGEATQWRKASHTGTALSVPKSGLALVNRPILHPSRSAIKQMLTSAQKLHPKAGKYLLGFARAQAVDPALQLARPQVP